jgi:hypothetical protein
MLYLHRIKTHIVFGILTVLSVSGEIHAQFTNRTLEINLPDHDSKPYYFGITIGGNSSRFHTHFHPQFLLQDSVEIAEPTNAGGASLGLAANLRISDRFIVRFNPQLYFLERSIAYKLKYPDPASYDKTEVIKKVESVTMSFPLQVKFQSDRIGNFRVYALGGFKADIDMASNARAKRAEQLVKIEKNDFGPEFGIGFNFFFPTFIFSPEIKISNGVRNIHARDENLRFSNVFDKIQSRMISFTIHLEG